MSRRVRLLATLMVVAMLAGCGGDGGLDDPNLDPADGTDQDGGSTDPDDGVPDPDSPGTDDPTNAGGGGAPVIDPSAMPAAGEVLFEVDGQEFTIEAAEMDYFTCEPDDAFTSVRSESETQDLSVQFDAQLGRGNATVIVEGSEVRYDSSFGPETSGGTAVDPPYIVYEGRFDASNLDDLSDITDVGMGRVSVTCP